MQTLGFLGPPRGPTKVEGVDEVGRRPPRAPGSWGPALYSTEVEEVGVGDGPVWLDGVQVGLTAPGRSGSLGTSVSERRRVLALLLAFWRR